MPPRFQIPLLNKGNHYSFLYLDSYTCGGVFTDLKNHRQVEQSFIDCLDRFNNCAPPFLNKIVIRIKVFQIGRKCLAKFFNVNYWRIIWLRIAAQIKDIQNM